MNTKKIRGLRKRSMVRGIILITLVAFLYSCVALKQREEYYSAIKQDRYADAYGILKELCAKNPSDFLCNKMEETSRKYAGQRLKALTMATEDTPEPVPMEKLALFEKELEEVAKINPSVDVTEVKALIEKKRENTIKTVRDLMERAHTEGEAKRIKDALALFEKAVRLDPSRQAAFEEYRARMLGTLYEEGLMAKKEERWKIAHKIFSTIYEIDPAFRDVKEELALAEDRDSYGYHIEEAKRAFGKEDFERTLRFAELSIAYSDTKEARELINTTLEMWAERLLRAGMEFSREDLLLSSGATFLKAMSLIKRLPYEKRRHVSVPAGEIKRVVDEMFVRAKEEWQNGEKEIAYLYIDIVSRIEPAYPEMMTIRDGWKEELERYSHPTIAIIPFSGPSYNVDAGNMLATRILYYVYNELGKDVKILERSAMEAIIKEKEVKALQGGELRSDILKLIGADYLIIGSVTNYRVENAVLNNFRTLRAKVGTRKSLNPEYEEWAAKGRTGSEPPKYIDEPVFENVKYRITHYKKVASVSVGWRVVDSNGNIIYVDVVEKKEARASEGREGVSMGDINIEEKLPSLPADSELLKTVEDEVVEEIGGKLKALFSEAEKRLFQKAVRLEESGNLRKSLKELVKARFIAENKGVDATPIKQQMQKILAEGVI